MPLSSGRACADGGAWWADAGPKFHVTGSGERQGAIHHKSLPLSTTCFSTNTKQPQLSFSCCPPRLHWPWCVALITNESQPESFTSCSFHHLSAVCGLVEAGCYWVAMVGPTDRHCWEALEKSFPKRDDVEYATSPDKVLGFL